MGSDYPSKNLPPSQGGDLFKNVDSTLMDADLTLGNLEGTLLTGGVCTKKVQKGRCYAPILKVVLDSTGVFQHGKIISAIQRTYKYLALDSLHRVAKLVKELSVQDFPDSAPIISDQGMIYPRIKE